MAGPKSRKKKPVATWEVIILGCGTSTGVPLMFCDCKVCRSRNPKNKRLRASIWLRAEGKSVLIDTSTDLRQQALRERIPRIDCILYTHPHADHVSGIDEMRAFNYIQKQRIPAYGNAWTCEELRSRFPYIFAPADKIEGGGIPLLDLRLFEGNSDALDAEGLRLVPVSLAHGSQECIGYRYGSLAYITDCSTIPEPSMKRLEDLDTLVLDCLRIAPHGTHFNLEQSLAIVERLKPKRTVLTHLGHDFDYDEWVGSKRKRGKLPPNVTLAYDGMHLRG
jgi:phosphoribosyl 1,2-cyclic phosphate phosphodiesterase